MENEELIERLNAMEKQLKNQLKELHTIRAEFLAKHLEESEELPQEFIKLMGKARSGGLLNENYQPLISQTESALLVVVAFSAYVVATQTLRVTRMNPAVVLKKEYSWLRNTWTL